MRVLFFLLAGVTAAYAACDGITMLSVYGAARQEHGDCGAMTASFGASFLGAAADSIDYSGLCADDCTMSFLFEAVQSGCADNPQVVMGFNTVMEECGCAVDEAFVTRGGDCVTGGDCDVCQGRTTRAHFDEPYIAAMGGHAMEVHVAGAKLTIESGKSTPESAGGSADGTGVGRCSGDFVMWDSSRQQCMPHVEYIRAGTQLVQLSNIASRADFDDMRTTIRQAHFEIEARVNSTVRGIIEVAEALVASNVADIADLQGQTGDLERMIERSVDEMEEYIGGRVSEVQQLAEEQIAGSIGDLSDEVASIQGRAEDTFAVFEHTPFLDHSLPVYRWGEWSSYAQCCGWFNGNSPTLFGGIHPSHWGDAWGHGRAHQLNGDKNSLRTLFNKRGYCGWQCTATAQQWRSYSSTNSRHFGVLFRIRNTGSSHINWRISYRYSCYSGWGEHASVTLNGADNWWSGGTNTAYSHVNVNLNIPPNRISTVIVITASSQASGDFRTTLMGFQDNCLRLPSGLEYVDDMDYVQGSWNT